MSQFDALFKTNAKVKTEDKPRAKREKKKPDTSLSPTVKTPAVPPTEKRSTGKSSNPDYAQVLTYIRRDTHNRVKAALIFDKQRRDLSDLVEELLSGWVKNSS